jgi:integrase
MILGEGTRMKFKELADQWLAKQRNRAALGKMKPASLATFEQRVRTHILPGLAEVEIETKSIVEDGEKREIQFFRPSVIKAFAESLTGNLGPKTIREVLILVKAILEGSTDSEGEPTIQIKWRPPFIFENVREVGQQKQPTISQDALNSIIKDRSIRARDRVLIALGAATGMRIGEILALRFEGGDKSTTWDSTDAIHVRQSIWNGQIQLPKTDPSIRQVDISSAVVKMLSEFCAAKIPGDFIFPNTSGEPMQRSYVHHQILTPAGVPGAHSLRRYRATWADEQRTPRSLLAAWLGHSHSAGAWESESARADSDGGMTNTYIKSAENQAYRRKWCERIGTGLEIAAATLPSKPHKHRKIAVVAEPQPGVCMYGRMYGHI